VLLFVDAWFDITTSANRNQFLEALTLALLVEIPAALFSLFLARRVSQQIIERAHLLPSRASFRRRRPNRQETTEEPLG
jgi:hypothetical protein